MILFSKAWMTFFSTVSSVSEKFCLLSECPKIETVTNSLIKEALSSPVYAPAEKGERSCEPTIKGYPPTLTALETSDKQEKVGQTTTLTFSDSISFGPT